jgi:hypothetical protein
MKFSIDILKLGKADATIIWAKDGDKDYVIFLDGGKEMHGSTVVEHYRTYIAPHVGDAPHLLAINTHIHDDHIGGLSKIVQTLHPHVKAVYFNNPAAGQQGELLQEDVARAIRNGLDLPHIQHLNESLEQARDFSAALKHKGIIEYPALAGVSLPPPFGKHIRIIGPSAQFYYQNMRAAGIDILPPTEQEEADFINEQVGSADPCKAIETSKDRSYENKVSVMIELVDQNERRYLFTADASAPSFESAVAMGHPLNKYHFVQLPHHGSRRNMDAKWIKQFSPNIFWIAAPGSSKHPSQALVDCIKQQLPACRVYSTNLLTGDWMNYVSDPAAFPPRRLQPAPTF